MGPAGALTILLWIVGPSTEKLKYVGPTGAVAVRLEQVAPHFVRESVRLLIV